MQNDKKIWIIIGVVIMVIFIMKGIESEKKTTSFSLYNGDYQSVYDLTYSGSSSYCRAITGTSQALRDCFGSYNGGGPYVGFKGRDTCDRLTSDSSIIYNNCMPLGCGHHGGADVCSGGNVYWADSCGGTEELKETCSSGCSGGVCNPPVCNTDADTNCDGIVDRTELGISAATWLSSSLPADRTQLGLAAQAWIDKGGPI